MSFEYGRGKGNASIEIDVEKCTICGLCVEVCKGAPLQIFEHKLVVDQSQLFGCIGCGACMAICPNDAIKINGRDISFADTFPLPPKNEGAGYEQFLKMLQSRRSIRDFQDREVESEMIEKILRASATAPMGIPPSEVGVVVLSGRKKVAELRDSLLSFLKQMAPYFSPFMLALMRPFMSKEDYLGMKSFVAPVIRFYLKDAASGRDWFFYDAPLAFCFHANAYADPADAYIAATYAMLAGQALGLGTCMLGFPMMMVQYSGKIRKEFHFPKKIRGGLVVIMGYPKLKYRRGIERRFASVDILS
jgi:nitroreductase/NAD-dependent dihydropyrimidine dehydrogenase PreA subunit